MPKSRQESSGEMSSYLGHLTRAPLLSYEEEVTLARASQAGDEEARKRLIESNMRLVINIARTYMNGAVPLEDLIQEGALGLMRAVERFDIDRGFRFSTYATHWIRQSILRALDNKGKTIRVPAHVQQMLRRIERERDQYLAQMGHEITPELLAERVGMDVEKLRTLLSNQTELLSLDARTKGGEGITLGATIPDEEINSPEYLLLSEELWAQFEECLNELTEREAEVIRMRMSTGNSVHFREEMARHLRLSQERVRQLEITAIQKLRMIARQRRLAELLPDTGLQSL